MKSKNNYEKEEETCQFKYFEIRNRNPPGIGPYYEPPIKMMQEFVKTSFEKFEFFDLIYEIIDKNLKFIIDTHSNNLLNDFKEIYKEKFEEIYKTENLAEKIPINAKNEICEIIRIYQNTYNNNKKSYFELYSLNLHKLIEKSLEIVKLAKNNIFPNNYNEICIECDNFCKQFMKFQNETFNENSPILLMGYYALFCIITKITENSLNDFNEIQNLREKYNIFMKLLAHMKIPRDIQRETFGKLDKKIKQIILTTWANSDKIISYYIRDIETPSLNCCSLLCFINFTKNERIFYDYDLPSKCLGMEKDFVRKKISYIPNSRVIGLDRAIYDFLSGKETKYDGNCLILDSQMIYSKISELCGIFLSRSHIFIKRFKGNSAETKKCSCRFALDRKSDALKMCLMNNRTIAIFDGSWPTQILDILDMESGFQKIFIDKNASIMTPHYELKNIQISPNEIGSFDKNQKLLKSFEFSIYGKVKFTNNKIQKVGHKELIFMVESKIYSVFNDRVYEGSLGKAKEIMINDIGIINPQFDYTIQRKKHVDLPNYDCSCIFCYYKGISKPTIESLRKKSFLISGISGWIKNFKPK